MKTPKHNKPCFHNIFINFYDRSVAPTGLSNTRKYVTTQQLLYLYTTFPSQIKSSDTGVSFAKQNMKNFLNIFWSVYMRENEFHPTFSCMIEHFVSEFTYSDKPVQTELPQIAST